MKPVGLVHFATARSNGPILHRRELFGDLGREQVRMEAVRVALDMIRETRGGLNIPEGGHAPMVWSP